MALVVVEYQFDSPPTDEELRKLDLCMAVREVVALQVYRSRDGRRQVRLFEAADAESVRQAHHSAGMPFAACWAADQSS